MTMSSLSTSLLSNIAIFKVKYANTAKPTLLALTSQLKLLGPPPHWKQKG